MATETSTEPVNTSPEETSAPEDTTNTDTSSQTTSEPEGNGQQQDPTSPDSRLPDDHPLVTALERQKQVNTELKAKADKVTELETQVNDLTSKAEAADKIQLRYDRLEAFLTQVGGPLSKALDSRSFTQALFESDKDIKDLVIQWHRDNPSATSSALNSGPGHTEPTKDMNALLRSAAK